MKTLKISVLSAGVLSMLLVSSTAFASIDKQLSFGARNSEVTELQQFLASSRFVYPEGIVSGYFGGLTTAAVMQFQVAYDLPQAGRVGPMTQAKINTIMSSGLGLDIEAPIMSNLALQVGRTDTIISWVTSEPSLGQVYYDTATLRADEETVEVKRPYISGMLASNNTNGLTSQSITLTGLQPNTVYNYIARSIDNSGNITMTWTNTFRTNQ